ncbi:hypothetical protein DFH28DRAFT_1080603 [Melampsora americana]|nr:hypothetical protein DFH28DRAFT_1080603 [Melampsora americana]
MSAEELHRIACQALQAFSSNPGTQNETPSVISILASYQEHGNGNAGLLLAILQAKRKEDERLAARDNLEAARLRAQHYHRTTLTMPSSPPGSSDMVVCDAPSPKPVAHAKPFEGTVRPKTSASSSSNLCPAALTKSKKRGRESSKGELSSHETVTRQDVNAALLAKIARSDFSNPKRLTASLPAQNPSSSIPARLPHRKSSSSCIQAGSSSPGQSPLANTPECSPHSHHASPPRSTSKCVSNQAPDQDVSIEGCEAVHLNILQKRICDFGCENISKERERIALEDEKYGSMQGAIYTLTEVSDDAIV